MSRLPAYIIYNDRDAMNLDHLLIARPASPPESNRVVVHLQGTTQFTEKGARKVVKCILALDKRPSVHVMIAPTMLDFAFVANIVKILYLKANKPELYVFDTNLHREAFDDHHCRMLQQNRTHLKEYSFGIIRSKAASIQFGISLQGNTELQTLTLLNDESLSPDQARVLAAGICNSALTTLIIRNDHLNARGSGGDGLRVLLQEGIQASGRILKSLQFTARGQKLNISELAEIVSCVESFTLKGTSIGLPEDKSHFQCLCERIEGTSNLLGLTLQQCGLDDGAMTMLAIGLRNIRSMEKLNLFDNNIGNFGVAAFVENWPEDSKLELFNLGRNRIGPDGLQQLMTALSNRHALKTLVLEENSFDCDGVEIIGNHLPYLRLREIVLGEVLMYDAEARTRAMHSWLRGIKTNYLLQRLTLNCSFPPLEFMHEIVFYTKLNKFGRHLLRIANDVPAALWCLIFAKSGIGNEFRAGIVFHLLMEQPHLVQPLKIRKRRPTQPTIPRRSARLRVEIPRRSARLRVEKG